MPNHPIIYQVTQPCEGMRAAMASAKVGDDVYGEDPTTKLLQVVMLTMMMIMMMMMMMMMIMMMMMMMFAGKTPLQNCWR